MRDLFDADFCLGLCSLFALSGFVATSERMICVTCSFALTSRLCSSTALLSLPFALLIDSYCVRDLGLRVVPALLRG